MYHFNVLQGSYAFVLGIVVCLAYAWLDSIWAAVSVHIAYNFTSVVITNLMEESDLSVATLAVMTAVGIAVSAVGLVVCGKNRKVKCYR